MKILMLSIDGKIFEEDSAVRSRMASFGAIFDELHVIVYTHRTRRAHRRRFTPSGVDGFDGAPLQRVEALRERHRRRGGTFEKEKVADNVFAYPTNSLCKPFFLFDFLRIARIILKERTPEERWAVTSQDAFTNVVGAFLKLRYGIPLQVQIHTDFLSPHFRRESLKNFFRFLCYSFGVRHADCIRVVSKRIKEGILKLRTLNQKPITVLPVSADVARQERALEGGDIHRRYPQFDFLVLIASRLTKEKNISLALEAIEKVATKYPKTGLLIVGDGPEKQKLERAVRRRKLTGNVVFESWRHDILSYYRYADLFLLTSWYEGYGLVLVEAALAKCTIVSTDVGLVGEMLQDNESALICPPGDAGCIAENIIRLREDKNLREKISGNAHDAAREEVMSAEAYLSRFRELFESCLVKTQKT